MNEEEIQVDLGNEPAPQPGGAELSDDDLAASLGLMTTLSESSMNPEGEETDLQEPGTEGDKEELAQTEEDAIETDGTPDKDEAQDAEIADIKAQLEQLLAQENEQETTDSIPS